MKKLIIAVVILGSGCARENSAGNGTTELQAENLVSSVDSIVFNVEGEWHAQSTSAPAGSLAGGSVFDLVVDKGTFKLSEYWNGKHPTLLYNSLLGRTYTGTIAQNGRKYDLVVTGPSCMANIILTIDFGSISTGASFVATGLPSSNSLNFTRERSKAGGYGPAMIDACESTAILLKQNRKPASVKKK